MGKSYKVIAPDRFLTTRPYEGCVTVLFAGKPVASSRNAVLLNEGDRAPVAYLPKRDVGSATLAPSSTVYQCRWKGDAEYFNVECDESVIDDGAWAYPEAPDDLESLRDRIAFDASTFEIQLDNASVTTYEGHNAVPQVEAETE